MHPSPPPIVVRAASHRNALRTCEVCERPAESGDRCSGHRKQAQRGKPTASLRERHASPLDRLLEAALAYAEAEEDEDYDKAKDRIRKAAVAYAKSIPAGALLFRVRKPKPKKSPQLGLFG